MKRMAVLLSLGAVAPPVGGWFASPDAGLLTCTSNQRGRNRQPPGHFLRPGEHGAEGECPHTAVCLVWLVRRRRAGAGLTAAGVGLRDPNGNRVGPGDDRTGRVADILRRDRCRPPPVGGGPVRAGHVLRQGWLTVATSSNTLSSSTLALVADIGGTNARFALTDPRSPTPTLLHAQSLRNADFANLQRAAEHYLGTIGEKPRRAAIAVASPVVADEIHLTNRAWSFSRRGLQQALGLDELRVLNDFGAIAWAVPALRDDEHIALCGFAAGPLRGPVTVLGPGTGFGVGLLVGSDAGGWHAVATEGGHVTFAPIGEEEHAIAAWVDERHGRTSYERLLSGSGLSSIDAVLRGLGGDSGHDASVMREPDAIVAAALEGDDPIARRALARFCAVLGSVAGDVALIHGARTLMIAGGIVPRFVPFLRSSDFRERFLAKGRFAAYLEQVAIHVITHPHPGLLGAATALRVPAGVPQESQAR
ncbi:glucokinase [Montanilutibacter psychrotolerans]|uniref:Glucokinase n=1 Tax=Montanilutibacter psychrotolerans TaxID=1327343 RepID=A0A3M8SUV6_9GAMM|nr:glucokinase [Lysobacter psychrotolerans]RNF84573.1 glucokinase [Lysobacter psychrotolerans]